MARRAQSKSDTPRKPGMISKISGTFKQLWQVFTMTRKVDPAVLWWMLGALALSLVVFGGLGVLFHGALWFYLTFGFMTGILAALFIMARRAERAAFTQMAGQPGASLQAMKSLRKGWNYDETPVQFDARSQDLVFRAVGRPGVVLVAEGPMPRSTRLAETERKRINRVLPNVPVHILQVGDGKDQVQLRKLAGTMTRLKPALDKSQVSEVAKRLRSLGGVKPPVPKGVDPFKARPDRRATRGR